MKRLLFFILGLWILVVVGVLLFMYVDHSSITEYQEQLQSYNWFQPALYWAAGLLLAVGLFLIIWSFLPSYKSRGLVMSYADGEIFLNKRSVEKTVLHTVRKYDEVRQPTIDVQLFQKRQKSFVDVKVDLFVTQTENVQTYLETIREDIKQTTERFAEMPVREVTLHVLDQKSLNKRVL